MDTTVSRDGTRIAYETSGSGPPLVVVNGALSDRRTTAALRPRLDSGFTVVAYDRRGRGDSGDTSPYAPEREIEDLAAVIHAVGAPAFVFGQSSGGILALRGAVGALPIRSLAVNEPPFLLPGLRPVPGADIPARMAARIAAGDREGALQIFFGDQVGIPAPALAQLRASRAWTAMLALAHTAPYDAAVAAESELSAVAVGKLAIPTLVLTGGASFPWLGATARAVAEAIPGAVLDVLPGQQHSPAPDVLAPALIRFFDG
jgi:pimeloyl-ACP methyl ester carboxylesterase